MNADRTSSLDHAPDPGPVLVVGDLEQRSRLPALLQAQGIDATAVPAASARPARAVVSCHRRLGRAELTAIRDLRARTAEAALVVVLEHVTPRAVQQALAAGADGLVAAAEAGRALVPALRAAAAGLVAFPVEIQRRLTRPVLSTREKQVLGLVVLGFGNAEIAARLHVAETTVKTHLSSIFAKLGVRSRSEAASLVLDPVRGHGLGILSITDARSADGRS